MKISFKAFNPNSTRFMIIALVGWLFLVFATLIGFSVKNIVPFDPFGEMIFSSTLASYDKDLIAALEIQGFTPGSVIHFRSEKNCFCDTLAEKPSAEITAALKEDGYESYHVTMSRKSGMRSYIASTPSVVIWGVDGSLKYVGPYAEGMGCFSGDSNAEAIINIGRNKKAVGPFIAVDSSGCYCH